MCILNTSFLIFGFYEFGSFIPIDWSWSHEWMEPGHQSWDNCAPARPSSFGYGLPPMRLSVLESLWNLQLVGVVLRLPEVDVLRTCVGFQRILLLGLGRDPEEPWLALELLLVSDPGQHLGWYLGRSMRSSVTYFVLWFCLLKYVYLNQFCILSGSYLVKINIIYILRKAFWINNI